MIIAFAQVIFLSCTELSDASPFAIREVEVRTPFVKELMMIDLCNESKIISIDDESFHT